MRLFGPDAPAAVRGVWGRALSLLRPPACGAGGQASHCCEWRAVLDAPPPRPSVPGAGSQRPCVPGVRDVGMRAQQRSHCSCAPRGRWDGVPWGGALCRCEGRLGSGNRSPPTARPRGRQLGLAAGVLVWGRGAVSLACLPCRGLRATGVAAEGRPGG